MIITNNIKIQFKCVGPNYKQANNLVFEYIGNNPLVTNPQIVYSADFAQVERNCSLEDGLLTKVLEAYKSNDNETLMFYELKYAQ